MKQLQVKLSDTLHEAMKLKYKSENKVISAEIRDFIKEECESEIETVLLNRLEACCKKYQKENADFPWGAGSRTPTIEIDENGQFSVGEYDSGSYTPGELKVHYMYSEQDRNGWAWDVTDDEVYDELRESHPDLPEDREEPIENQLEGDLLDEFKELKQKMDTKEQTKQFFDDLFSNARSSFNDKYEAILEHIKLN